jgi:hypothetical protein
MATTGGHLRPRLLDVPRCFKLPPTLQEPFRDHLGPIPGLGDPDRVVTPVARRAGPHFP